jgi:hypothetical protein
LEELMVRGAPGKLLLLVALVAITGCYDVHPVDSDKWLIDDFEGADGQPSDGHPDAVEFERWECRERSAILTERGGCNVVRDDQRRSHVLHMGARLDSEVRAELATFAYPPLDLTGYDELRFSAKLVPVDSFSLKNVKLKAQLTCTRVLLANGKPSPNPCIVSLLTTVSSDGETIDWTSFSPRIFEFHAPDLERDKAVDWQDCLTSVDGIKITVDSTEGVQTEFDLYVDDVQLVTRR